MLPPSDRAARDRRVARSGRRRWRGILIGGSVALLLGAAAAAMAVVLTLDRIAEPPRTWAPYLLRRASGHDPVIRGATALLAAYLNRADRLPYAGPVSVPPWFGAAPSRPPAPVPPGGRLRPVGSLAALGAALASARPGDVIELLPGTYRLEGRGFYLDRAGTALAPITLRAARLGQAVIRSDVVEAIKVAAPHWRFENLVIEGVCGDDSDCEHAFHVVGAASDTVIRNSRLENFNAQIKINHERGLIPDDGRIEHDSLVNTHPRRTPNPMTPIDLDTASGWLIRGNLIADFVKYGGNGVSYGAFAKATGSGNRFIRNLVLCRWRLPRYPGQQIGLSFGGGGSPDSIRRDHGRTGLEALGGTMRDNLIAFCSDDGIYVNRSANVTISHNTLIDTGGIDVRFRQSSAVVQDNLVDGAIRTRDGAVIEAGGNRATWLPLLFLGWHPERALFADPARLALFWRQRPQPVGLADPHRDLCGAARPPRPLPGAFQDWTACVVRPAAAGSALVAGRAR